MGSILFAHQVPKNGGDTMFSSMYAAYESLSDGLKDTLKNLYGRHSSRHVFGKSYVSQTNVNLLIGKHETAICLWREASLGVKYAIQLPCVVVYSFRAVIASSEKTGRCPTLCCDEINTTFNVISIAGGGNETRAKVDG